MNKIITLVFTLCLITSTYAVSLSSAVQFDPVKKVWNSNATPINGMPYVKEMVTIGKMSFAFGCLDASSCPRTSFANLISFNLGSGWSTTQSLQNMSSFSSALLYPIKNTSMLWILGSDDASHSLVISYFDGAQFSPGINLPVKVSETITGLPMVVSQKKLWVFDSNSHHSYWTTNTVWNAGPDYPGAAALKAVTKDDISDDIYLLQQDGTINHLNPDQTWSTIQISNSSKGIPQDIRVFDQGKIIIVLVNTDNDSHVFVTEDSGKTWTDTGALANPLNNLANLYNDSTNHLFWQYNSSGLSLLNPDLSEPSWDAIPPKNIIQLPTSTTSMDGSEFWIYGTLKNGNTKIPLILYYSTKTRVYKYLNLGLKGIADEISVVQPSNNGKAFAIGSYLSTPVALYYDGEQWYSTPLNGVGSDLDQLKLSHLPLGFFADDQKGYLLFKNKVDFNFDNVWIHN